MDKDDKITLKTEAMARYSLEALRLLRKLMVDPKNDIKLRMTIMFALLPYDFPKPLPVDLNKYTHTPVHINLNPAFTDNLPPDDTVNGWPGVEAQLNDEVANAKALSSAMDIVSNGGSFQS